jgi:hypothetical protein
VEDGEVVVGIFMHAHFCFDVVAAMPIRRILSGRHRRRVFTTEVLNSGTVCSHCKSYTSLWRVPVFTLNKAVWASVSVTLRTTSAALSHPKKVRRTRMRILRHVQQWLRYQQPRLVFLDMPIPRRQLQNVPAAAVSGKLGSSHHAPMQTKMFAPPAPPLDVSDSMAASSLSLLRLSSDWHGDWHPTPARQWLFFLAGKVEMEASEGAIHFASADSIVFLEDASRKGHSTRVVGGDAVIIAAVQVHEDNSWPPPAFHRPRRNKATSFSTDKSPHFALIIFRYHNRHDRLDGGK